MRKLRYLCPPAAALAVVLSILPHPAGASGGEPLEQPTGTSETHGCGDAVIQAAFDAVRGVAPSGLLDKGVSKFSCIGDAVTLHLTGVADRAAASAAEPSHGLLYLVEPGQPPRRVGPNASEDPSRQAGPKEPGDVSALDAFAITSTYAGTNDRLLYGLRDPYSGIITRTLGAIQFRTRLQLYYSPHHFRIGWNNDWLDKEYYDALQVTYEADMKQVRSYQTDPVVHSWAGGTFSYVSSYSQGDPKEVYTPSPSGKDFYVDMQSVTIRDPDWGVFYAGGHIRSLTIRCNSSSCYFI